MTRLRYLALLGAAVSMLLFAAACSGDDDDSSTSTPTETEEEGNGAGDDDDATEPEDSGDADATEDADDGDDDATADEGGGGVGLPEDLQALLGDLDTFTAEYDFEVTGDGAFDGQLTLTSDAGNLRLDFTSDDGDGTVIITGEASYFCAEGLSGGDDACFEFPGGEDLDQSGIPFADIFGDLLTGGTAEGISIEDADDQEVAGEQASCFTLTQQDIEGEALVCFADNGIPVLVDGSGEGQEFHLEATDISEDVADDAFEPPYPIEQFDFGDLGGLGGD
ncbi:MAG: hypothetical protein WEB00_15325 [Dehalococcoidia bacterium]